VISPIQPADSTPSGRNIVADQIAKHSFPGFLQPPPPQNHLGSQQLPNTVLIPNSAKQTSDSGYASAGTLSDILPSSSPWNEDNVSRISFELPPPVEPVQELDPSPLLEPSLDIETLMDFRDPNTDLSRILDPLNNGYDFLWRSLQ
jgi:hypothetical protein